jgi:diguanylate cyclase (GGDEF)-like protein
MRAHALERLLRRRPAIVVAGSTLAILGVGWLDAATGARLSFSLFYLVPVASATWAAGARAGGLMALLAAAMTLAGELRTDDPELVAAWNALVRLGVLWVVTATLSRLRAALETERRLAETDPLTGALNPRAFDAVAGRELLRALRYGRPLTLAYLDLDGFKLVNDTLGHSVGDRLLQAFVAELSSQVRPSDVVARMGGDEFAILMPETTPEQAEAVLARIREQVLERMRMHGWPVTVSAGTSAPSGPGTTVDALVADADRAMYEDKRRARERNDPSVPSGVGTEGSAAAGAAAERGG